jgi:hypothetical protein
VFGQPNTQGEKICSQSDDEIPYHMVKNVETIDGSHGDGLQSMYDRDSMGAI